MAPTLPQQPTNAVPRETARATGLRPAAPGHA